MIFDLSKSRMLCLVLLKKLSYFETTVSVMYGCSGQHHSRVVQLAEPFHTVHQEKGANPSHLHKLGC